MVTVTDDMVAEYLPRIHRYARFYDRKWGAEYDDLVQEASEYAFMKLRAGEVPSNTGLKGVMKNWVRFCKRRGVADGKPLPE